MSQRAHCTTTMGLPAKPFSTAPHLLPAKIIFIHLVHPLTSQPYLGTPVAARQLPGGHPAGGEERNLVGIVDAPDPDHVVLVRGVVERAVQRAVVADGGHHQDAAAGDLPHLHRN